MDQRRDNLLPIGSFARVAHLSLKAMRLYAALGLLVPHYVDPENGYRYYHADQLHAARLVRMMRQMDMPLATIRQVLAAAPADAETLVHAHVREMEQRAEQARRMVYSLMNYLQQEEPGMALEINVRTAEPQPIISMTKHVKVGALSQTIGSSLDALYTLLKQRGVEATGAPFGIYHGAINNEDDGPIEVCVPVARMLEGTGDIQARELPGGNLASVMLTGAQCDFPAILQGYDETADWIRSNGYEMTGPPLEIWHSAPGEDARMEVAWPFKER